MIKQIGTFQKDYQHSVLVAGSIEFTGMVDEKFNRTRVSFSALEMQHISSTFHAFILINVCLAYCWMDERR